MKLPSIHTALHLAAMVSTAASVKGTLNYLLTETHNDWLLAGTGAGGLGLAIYLGWEVAFGHSGKIKRLAAAVIAVTAATLSSYTIYQNTALPTITQAQDAKTAQDTRAQQQQDATAAALKQQQDDLRQQINDLRNQNTLDTTTITNLDTTKKGADQQAAKLRKAIETRNTDIGKLTTLAANYTDRLTVTPTTKTDTTTVNAPIILSWAMLARASSYEIMTALFLLFGNWYRTDRRDQENTQIQQLQTVAADTQAIILKLESVIAHADHRAADIATNMTDWATKAHAAITALETLVDQSPQQQAALTDLHRKIDQQLTAAATLIRSLDASTTTATDTASRVESHANDLNEALVRASACTNELQKAYVRTNEALVRASACTSQRTSACTSEQQQPSTQTNDESLADDSAWLLISMQQIEPNDAGEISTSILMKATGYGRRRAEKLRDQAIEAGILTAETSKRGVICRYAQHNTQPTTTHSDNVVTLKRSA